jgi:hypothetical protein
VRLKSKYLGISVDDLPDTATAKALTNSEQTIEGAKTFSRAPRISSMPAEWDDRNLVPRALVAQAERYMELNSAKILPLKVTAESLLLNAFAIPEGITDIPFYVVYGGKRYATGGENPTAKVIEHDCKRFIYIMTKPVKLGDDCVAYQSYDNWWGIPYMG